MSSKYKAMEVYCIALHTACRLHIKYMGSKTPKMWVLTEPWECHMGHRWEVSIGSLSKCKSKFGGCQICHLKPLDKTGQLLPRLDAANVNLLGLWKGAKKINEFECRSCQHTWPEWGLCITNQGKRCPECFPRGHSRQKVHVPVYLPAIAGVVASPPG